MILVPITSPETSNSSRRICCRPSVGLFDAMSRVLPNPVEVVEDSGTPCCVSFAI
jgi:hypothetical protein